MSATVARAMGRQSRLQRIDEGIDQREAKLAEARREIVELAGREHEAAAEALRRDPSKSAYALRSPAHELKRKRLELEKGIGVLEQELALLRSDRVAADAEQGARELGERTDEARDLVQREREARLAAGKAFAAFVACWNDLAEVLSKRSELVSTVAAEQLVDRIGIFDRETIEAWEAVAGYLVTPVPVDLRGFLDEAIEASTTSRPGEEQAGLQEMNAHRRVLGLAEEVRTVSPSARELADAYPDLRGEINRATVSGAEIRRSEPAEEAPWPERAA
jgi:hypothetical protein